MSVALNMKAETLIRSLPLRVGAPLLTIALVVGLAAPAGAQNIPESSDPTKLAINDTLQTMPLFVFLIPVIMFFLVGEFSALLAIIMYAIVPSIRYTEFGLRSVDPEVVEAAESMGCTQGQILRQVKLPLALPEIMLGLNQTVMYGLAMLVIAALIGTKGLDQLTLESVTKSNFGTGVIAGGGMALIAMITDRIIQSWSNRKKQELGLA